MPQSPVTQQHITVLISSTRKLGILGSGEFGTVCKGQWVYADKRLDVAIKVLSDASDETNKVKFLQEAAIMSQFRHPNVIKLYGVVSDGQEVSTKLKFDSDIRIYFCSDNAHCGTA